MAEPRDWKSWLPKPNVWKSWMPEPKSWKSWTLPNFPPVNPGIMSERFPGGRTKLNQNKTSDPKLQDHNQKGLTLFPNWQGRPRRLLGARKRILAQHLLKRG